MKRGFQTKDTEMKKAFESSVKAIETQARTRDDNAAYLTRMLKEIPG